MEVEMLFFRYAFPALKMCGKANAEEIAKLEHDLMKGIVPDREKLESLFPKAFARIKRLAEKLGTEEYWTNDIVQEYWLREHNRIIEAGEDGYDKLNEKQREFCKVSLVELLKVERVDGKYKVKVKYNGREIESESLFPVRAGQKTTFHQGIVVEILSEEEIKKYFS